MSLRPETAERATIEKRFYRSGGEAEPPPVLPRDEVDRLASASAGLSAGGGVLGTRSGLSD